MILGEAGSAEHAVQSRAAPRVKEETVGMPLVRPVLWEVALVVGVEVI